MFSNAIWNSFRKIVKSSFFTSNLEVLKFWYFSISKLLVKKELFPVFVNWFQTALETPLWHIMWCCGYVTCSPWSREHVDNIFRSITCIKTFCGRKTWKDGSFCNLILTPKDCESASILEIYSNFAKSNNFRGLEKLF